MKFFFLIILMFTILAVRGQDEFTTSGNTFSLEAYRAIKPDSGNCFMSPVSINILLAMVMEGSGSETKERLTTLLQLKSIPDAGSRYNKLISDLEFQNKDEFQRCMTMFDGIQDRSRNDQFQLHNSLWYRTDMNIKPAFTNLMTSLYQAEEYRVDRSELSVANNNIQKWVREKTHNKIQYSHANFENDNPLILLNVVYFLAQWENPFNKKKTNDKKFFTLEKKVSEKKFMNGEMSLFYYEDENLQAVKLPYQCNSASMILVLPAKRYDLPRIEEFFNDSLYTNILSGMRRETVILSLPKFRLAHEIDITSWLSNLNIFSANLDLSGMLSEQKRWAPLILHKTFIETDEEKTEASALTEMVIVGGTGGRYEPPAPKIVNADHPFLFLIRDEMSGRITFMGRLAN